MKNSLLFIVLLIFYQCAWGADVLYVQGSTAKLLGRPSFNATLIEKLDKGTALEVIESSGRWIKVQHKKKIGWLPRLLLSKNPPMDLPSALQGKDIESKPKTRGHAASISTTAATTPALRNDSRSSAGDEGRTDHQIIENVDSVKVKQDVTENDKQVGLKQP